MAFFLFSLIVAVVVIVLFKGIKIILNLHRRRKLMSLIPGPPVKNVLLGNIDDMFASPNESFLLTKKLHEVYGSVVLRWFTVQPVISISSAKYAELYFHSKEIYQKSSFYYLFDKWIGEGLLLSDGPMWFHHRKLITPTFHFSILNVFAEIMVENAKHMVEKLRESPTGSVFDVYQQMHLISLENISETSMGVKLNALDNPKTEYIKATERAALTVEYRMHRPWTWNDFLFTLTPAGRKWTNDVNIIHALTNKVIQDKKEKLKQKTPATEGKESDEIGTKKKLAFLDVLLNASEAESNPLSEKELRDEVNTFMFEGHDTTTSALSWAIFLLGNHPDIQEKCFREQAEIFQGSDRRLTMDDVKEMKYLDQVVKESQRLLPSVPRISRKADQDFKFGDYMVAEGTLVEVDIFFLHRDPKYFPEPEKFDPDRFSFENSVDRHPYAYVPFAAGARNCIGQRYAILEIKIVLSYILRNFILESMCGLEDISFNFLLVLRPSKSLRVRFTAR